MKKLGLDADEVRFDPLVPPLFSADLSRLAVQKTVRNIIKEVDVDSDGSINVRRPFLSLLASFRTH